MVQGEVIHTFVLEATGHSLDFTMVRRLLALTAVTSPGSFEGRCRSVSDAVADVPLDGVPKGNVINKSISISKDLEVR